MATGPFSDAVLTEYGASAAGFSKTDDGSSIGASSPAKLDGRGFDIEEMTDLRVQV